MELADMRDLGSRAARRAGSTPVTRTKNGHPEGVSIFGERNRTRLVLPARSAAAATEPALAGA